MAEHDGKPSDGPTVQVPLHEGPLPEALGSTIRFFFANLFDLRMQAVVSMAILPVVYGLGIAIAAGGVITLIVLGFESSVGEGVFWLVLAGPTVFVAAVASLRIFLEFVLAIFRVSVQMDAIVEQTREIAVDLPRLRFWKNLRSR